MRFQFPQESVIVKVELENARGSFTVTCQNSLACSAPAQRFPEIEYFALRYTLIIPSCFFQFFPFQTVGMNQRAVSINLSRLVRQLPL
jgi:hypothetical protein